MVLVWGFISCSPKSEEEAAIKEQSQNHQLVLSAPLKLSAKNGTPLFEHILEKESGIDFEHQWSPGPKYAHLINGAMCGGGVAIGDIDGDGLPDVYLTRPHGGCRLYKNFGDFRFRDVTEVCGLENDAWGLGATFADIDDDRDLDLYVCSYDSPNRLFINNGSGTFSEQASAYGLDFKGASVMMAFADYDNDGDLDGYLLTNRMDPPQHLRGKGRGAKINGKWHVPKEYQEYSDVLVKPNGQPVPIQAGQFDHLYRNDGDRFVDVSIAAGINGNYFGLSATWWDYDSDGYPDLYVANDFYGPDHLYHNNQDGTFTDVAGEALPHTPWFSMGSAAGDINNDGRLDFIASDMSGSNHYRQKVAMGEMSENAWFLTSAEPRQYMRNAVYLNTGTKRFMEVAYLTGLADSNWTWSTKFADFDNDGWTDLFISNGMTRDWFNSDLREQSLAIGGFRDRRGWDFWLKQPLQREANLAFRNRANFSFESVAKDWGLDLSAVSFGAAIGDLDRDGDMDIVVNNFAESPAIYRNQSTANRLIVKLRGTQNNTFGIGAHVNLTTDVGTQTQEMTLASGFMSSDEPIISFGLGTAAFAENLTIRWPSGAEQFVKKVQANRAYTITEPETIVVEPTQEPSGVMFSRSREFKSLKHSETPYDDYVRQPLLPKKHSQLGPPLAAGDIDNDGDMDFFVGGASGSAGTIYQNEGRAQFNTIQMSSEANSEDIAAEFFDADNDGDQDLLVVSGGVECGPGDGSLRDRLYLNDSHGHFTRDMEALPDLRDSGGCIATGDFDQDGDRDVFIGSRIIPGQYPLSPKSRLLINDGGKFSEASAPMSAGLVTGAVWADIDGDDCIDLAITTEWGPVKMWKNLQGQLQEMKSTSGVATLSGWWNAIAAGDIDSDGDIDFAVTNAGLNTKYHAPVSLYYGDVDGTGTMRLIEAEFFENTLYPVRGKSCSTAAIPTLRQRFQTFDAFARASLLEVYGSLRLQAASHFQATMLDHGILINDGSGRFQFRPLPRFAQAAPSRAVAMADFNHDGYLDLVLAQNFFGPQPETGRMDGGVSLVLLGHGNGEFNPVWPSASGVAVSGDAASVVTLDANGNGSQDLLFGINDEEPLLYLNR
jgi:enediyne biosynthesis protein E4